MLAVAVVSFFCFPKGQSARLNPTGLLANAIGVLRRKELTGKAKGSGAKQKLTGKAKGSG